MLLRNQTYIKRPVAFLLFTLRHIVHNRFFLVIRIGTPHPLARSRVCPPLWFWGGGDTRFEECPNSDEGQKLWYSRYICMYVRSALHRPRLSCYKRIGKLLPTMPPGLFGTS
jgi:hypothetical protein